MPFHRTLPDDSVLLRERDFEGLNLVQIAERHGVSKAAVSKRFSQMKRPFRASVEIDYADIIPWDIKGEHLALDANLRLRAHVRFRSDIELAPSAKRRLEDWWKRLAREQVVLTYDAEAQGSPWSYVEREPSDGSLVIRWPESAPPPTERQIDIFSAPSD